jgi:hypothetical protein
MTTPLEGPLLTIGGRIADIQNTSLDMILIIVLGQLGLPELRYIEELKILGAPRIELDSVDAYPRMLLDEEFLNQRLFNKVNKVVDSVFKSMAN